MNTDLQDKSRRVIQIFPTNKTKKKHRARRMMFYALSWCMDVPCMYVQLALGDSGVLSAAHPASCTSSRFEF
jgi:hypothetical protein